jgi:hypothetical protein
MTSNSSCIGSSVRNTSNSIASDTHPAGGVAMPTASSNYPRRGTRAGDGRRPAAALASGSRCVAEDLQRRFRIPDQSQ